MFEVLAAIAALVNAASILVNCKIQSKFIAHIKMTDNARKDFIKRRGDCDRECGEYSRKKAEYEARIKTLEHAEEIAAVLARKGESDA